MSVLVSDGGGFTLLEAVDYTGSLILVAVAASGTMDTTTSIGLGIGGILAFLVTLIAERLRQSALENVLRALVAIQQQTETLQFLIQFSCGFYDAPITGQNGFPTILNTTTNPPADVVEERIQESNALAIQLNAIIINAFDALPPETPPVIIQVAELLVQQSQDVVDAFASSMAVAKAAAWAANPANDFLRADFINAVTVYLIPAHELCGQSEGLGFVLQALVDQLRSNL